MVDRGVSTTTTHRTAPAPGQQFSEYLSGPEILIIFTFNKKWLCSMVRAMLESQLDGRIGKSPDIIQELDWVRQSLSCAVVDRCAIFQSLGCVLRQLVDLEVPVPMPNFTESHSHRPVRVVMKKNEQRSCNRRLLTC